MGKIERIFMGVRSDDIVTGEVHAHKKALSPLSLSLPPFSHSLSLSVSDGALLQVKLILFDALCCTALTCMLWLRRLLELTVMSAVFTSLGGQQQSHLWTCAPNTIQVQLRRRLRWYKNYTMTHVWILMNSTVQKS